MAVEFSANNQKALYIADKRHFSGEMFIEQHSCNYDPAKKRNLIDCLRDALRDRYYSYKTKDTYCCRIKKHILMNYRRGLMPISVRRLPPLGLCAT
jgi:hypothetical protein